jgi:hypothetical protein
LNFKIIKNGLFNVDFKKNKSEEIILFKRLLEPSVIEVFLVKEVYDLPINENKVS